ncbi:S-adenosyl-L-methionine-dependent methyltransferase [Desarmillaria tabescens]|uniref:Protein-lysine N-methyltransferase EFM4 n=1 Tax=Armillaria tabescens TaxID=1929756 RepID=A0AA39NQE8_ARMTA|nr:S-adenosyl-L-methionine-dependent methyltransferase [Desarmillaria tabescens]KAK0469714.1 S-adenosyl-L-methionine-dependent methyltransferase [Desarmillaria tabescens]
MSTDLQPSKLGNKEHWDDVYKTELEIFDETGDEGEIWYVLPLTDHPYSPIRCDRFGEESVEKMVDWTVENVPSSQGPSILEIGSGNGTLLFALLEAGYDATTLCGIDYSMDAVQLAQKISSTRDGERISFDQRDFLSEDPSVLPHMDQENSSGQWDLLLDKGTYDAIALGQRDELGRSPAYQYPSRAARLLKADGFFLITSCNFTEDELKAHFVTPETGFVYHSRIQHPTFMFGGKSGSICSSVAFKKM